MIDDTNRGTGPVWEQQTNPKPLAITGGGREGGSGREGEGGREGGRERGGKGGRDIHVYEKNLVNVNFQSYSDEHENGGKKSQYAL